MSNLTFVVAVVIFTVVLLAQTSSSGCNLKKKALKRKIMQYQKKCLLKGFQSSIGCEVGGGKLRKKAAKKCGKIEKSLKRCDYSCPVDGSWSDYNSEWTSCSVSCGGGSQTRDRSCSNPAPAFGGANCEGNAEETQKCNLHECPGKILRICLMLLNIIDKLSTYSYIS